MINKTVLKDDSTKALEGVILNGCLLLFHFYRFYEFFKLSCIDKTKFAVFAFFMRPAEYLMILLHFLHSRVL